MTDKAIWFVLYGLCIHSVSNGGLKFTLTRQVVVPNSFFRTLS